MKIDDKEWAEKFNSKKRQNCARCGGLNFRAFQLKGKENTPDMDVSEAVMLNCKDCGHTRFELM